MTPASTRYLLSTVEDTPLVVFQIFIKILDLSAGYQIVYPNIPWQEYSTNLTAVQAAGIALIPFINTVELGAPLPDAGGFDIREPSTCGYYVELRKPPYLDFFNVAKQLLSC